jgi:L-fuconolactonase
MPIIDTHQHLWDLDRVAYPWLTPDLGMIARTYVASELEPQLATAGVTHTVLVQAANSYADTEYMLEQSAIYSWMIGVVGWVPLLYPDVAGRAIERFGHYPLFKGVRHLIHNEPDPKWLLQDRVAESLRLLAGAGLTFDVVATVHEHMECIPILGERIPQLKMVIDHLGQPPIGTRPQGRWADDMRAAAENPNVYAKVSGLGTASGIPETWSAADVQPYIEFALDTFGPERCMAGGDWPVSVLAGGYVKAWTIYRDVLSTHADDVQDAVLSRTAVRFYGLQQPEG